MKEDAEQFVKASGMNRLGHFEANVEESWAAAPEKLSKVQEASVSLELELYLLASRRFMFISGAVDRPCRFRSGCFQFQNNPSWSYQQRRCELFDYG